VDQPTFRFALDGRTVDLAKLITQDVAQATAAEHAMRNVIGRHSLAGSTVVFASAQPLPVVVADLHLQSESAKTIDFAHGSGTNYWVGAVESQSSLRCVWTETDVAIVRDLGQSAVAAGMPRLIRRRARGRVVARNILIMDNYLHRDDKIGDTFAYEPFLGELLGTIPLIRGMFGSRFVFRWRPHPADNAVAVERHAMRYPGLEVSAGRSLADDVDWSDLVFSSLSSAAIECLFANVPVFLQAMPMFHGWPVVEAFARSRKFLRATETSPGFGHCIEELDAGNVDAMREERKTRQRLFGPSEDVASLWQIIRAGLGDTERITVEEAR
jgi:hypothetical protein